MAVRRWIPLAVGLLALAVYLLTLAPDLTWAHNGADGGDLIASSFVGGTAHPPGYPLYSWLGRIVAALPLGSIPCRYNLFSALAAAGAAALVAWAVEESGPLPALAAGLSLAFSPLQWSQAVVTEVYTLAALLAAFIVALSVRGKPHPLMLGLALGLGLTHHLTMIALAPLAWGALTGSSQEQGGRTTILRAAAGFGIGLLPLAYLPLASSAPVGWGNASTLPGFLWLLSAQLYRGYAFSLPAAWIGPRMAQVSHLLAASFTWLGVWVGLWGLATLWERDIRRGVGSMSAMLALVIFAIGYNTADSDVYLIPALVVFAVWIGLGWSSISSNLSADSFPRHTEGKVLSLLRKRRVEIKIGLSLLMLALPLLTLALNWSAQDLRTDRAARDFVNGIMMQAPEQAIIITSEDRHTFALWVGTLVEHTRPDLAIVDQDLLGYDWYRARLKRSFPDLTVADGVKSVNELVQLNPGRPVCRPAPTAPTGLSCQAR